MPLKVQFANGLLQGGDHTGDGVVESGLAFQIGLPESGEELEVVVPPALVEAFADGVRDVGVADDAGSRVGVGNSTFLFVRRLFADGIQKRFDDFAGDVKD